MTKVFHHLTREFPRCRRILGSTAWERILPVSGLSDPRLFVSQLGAAGAKFTGPAYLPDAAKLELKYNAFIRNADPAPSEAGDPATDPVLNLILNPDLLLIPVQWSGLPAVLGLARDAGNRLPEPGDTHVLIWRHPGTGDIHCRDAVDDDLLALKLAAESIPVRDAARMGNTSVRQIQAVLHRGISQGLLISPEPGLQRDRSVFEATGACAGFLSADVFTLQWHITQRCDLHCRHCYDRSDRIRPSLTQARSVLEDLLDFTQAMHVRGHVTFTGGNPLLYPEFLEVYGYAADLGFSTAILGNPANGDILDQILAVQPLTHYQISLEGLAPYNDYIRGPGHFRRSLAFLDLLRERGIHAMVMLTLNRDNMDDVLPLAEILKNRADGFTFNRLAMVGEGKHLRLPDPEAFSAFLASYLEAASANPVMTLKDNLFGILRESPAGGCTGYGCGAAFNFVSLLPDGEVHACRKFPSIIGNIHQASLLDVYGSPLARRYRNGSAACRGCPLFSTCRGCPAVVFGMGLDCFESRDPFCFRGHEHAP